MSLFKIRDIWSTQVNKVNSSHDEFCLKLSPLYKLNALQHFILVGTSSGMLSIFLPRAGDYTNADDFGYPSQHYNDLCLEYNMDEPILSIDCGSLNVELCQYQQIAVLHPQMVSVYSFTKSEDSIQEGDCETFSFDSWRLTSLFKHDFKKPSFNMSVERYFTHTQTDIILVQSIDASLCFFNLYGALFEITLGNILIPGPIVFLNSTQSLLTSDSRKLYCFSFMYSSTEHSRILYDENKNISLDWSLLFEEPIFNMQKIDSIYTATSRHSPLSYIIALGRRRVFLISETGSLLSTRRIDASPKHLCMYGYAEVDPLIAKEDCSGSNMQCMLTWQPRYLVTTEKNQLLVFKGTELLWSALLPFYQYRLSMPINTPPSNRCDSKTLPVIGEHFPPGLIVLLNSNGE
ncbi:unnamed protein product [Heterobilharzia americana]|nr:unnamed protein product [Heterobilharzia americana]